MNPQTMAEKNSLYYFCQKKAIMENEESEPLEPLEDWMKRMETILNKGKPYTKEGHDRMEHMYYESAYRELAAQLLINFMLKWHPPLQHAPPDFTPYIKDAAMKNFTQLYNRMWQIVLYNRQHKSPRDIPKTDFDGLMDVLKRMRLKEPVLKTAQDIDERGFSHWSEKKKMEFAAEINEDNMRSWKWLNDYTHEFIDWMQQLFFQMWPELDKMESEWWLLYEFDMLSQCGRLRDDAYDIQNVYEAGLDAKVLDEGPVAISERLRQKRTKK
jgi:hypothetical protein